MSGTASSPPAPRSWILGPWQDWVFFLGTPALILPLVFLARARFRVEDIYLFVASFGALGHHLPGMMRAYGDRELFRRFRVRFVVAPIFLVVACVTCSLRELSGLMLIVYLWGVWHGLAQAYGFLRIYDSKAQSSAAWTCRLDMAMCIAWFGGGVLLSPTRMHRLLDTFYQSGGAPLPVAWLGALRTGAVVTLVVVTAAFLVHTGLRARRGQPPSTLKLVLMATSFGFWWYSNVVVADLLVGIVLFEIFHDVQYLSIVWAFNRSRVEKGAQLGGFSRFLFRRGGALVGAYVGLVFAYGSLNYVAKGLPTETLQRTLTGVLVASALLHFYYDGFIWKVREKATRQSLGLAGGKEAQASAGLPRWLVHGAKWAFFVGPLAGLGLAQARGALPEAERARALAQAFELPDSNLRTGLAALATGDLPLAGDSFRAALARDPGNANIHMGLADLALAQGDAASAGESYRRALELDPKLAAAENGLGNVLLSQGDAPGAIAAYQRALALDPELSMARANLGNAFAREGRNEEAISELRRAIELEPDEPAVRRDLARTLAAAGRFPEAIGTCRAALALDPDALDTHYDLANLLAATGDLEGAVGEYRALLVLQPDHADGCYNLGNALVGLQRYDEAMALYRRAIAADPSLAEAYCNLGTLQVHFGALAEARTTLELALRLQPDLAEAHVALATALRGLGREEEAASHEAAAQGLAGAR